MSSVVQLSIIRPTKDGPTESPFFFGYAASQPVFVGAFTTGKYRVPAQRSRRSAIEVARCSRVERPIGLPSPGGTWRRALPRAQLRSRVGQPVTLRTSKPPVHQAPGASTISRSLYSPEVTSTARVLTCVKCSSAKRPPSRPRPELRPAAPPNAIACSQ